MGYSWDEHAVSKYVSVNTVLLRGTVYATKEFGIRSSQATRILPCMPPPPWRQHIHVQPSLSLPPSTSIQIPLISQTKMALRALTLFASLAAAQFPPKPEGVTTLRSKHHQGVKLSYKEPGLCETTPGVKSYAGKSLTSIEELSCRV